MKTDGKKKDRGKSTGPLNSCEKIQLFVLYRF
jgi:hypothetical protein